MRIKAPQNASQKPSAIQVLLAPEQNPGAFAFAFPMGSASNQHLQFGVVLVPSCSGAASRRVSQAQDITACQDIFQPPRLCQPCRSVKQINLSLELSLCLHWPSHRLNLGDYVHPGQVSSSLDHMCSQLLFNSDASGRRSTSLPAFWVLYYCYFLLSFFWHQRFNFFFLSFKFLSCQIGPLSGQSLSNPAPALIAKSDHDVFGSFSHHRIKGLFCQSPKWFSSAHQGRH